MRRVETVESKTRCCHVVENRCVYVGVSVVAGFFPSVVVTHKEDDVRSVLSVRRWWKTEDCAADEDSQDCAKYVFYHGLRISSELIRPLNDMNGLKATTCNPCLSDW